MTWRGISFESLANTANVVKRTGFVSMLPCLPGLPACEKVYPFVGEAVRLGETS